MFINSYFYVICNNKILFKGSLDQAIDYLIRISHKPLNYYYVVNALEYDHPGNVDKRFNSYYTCFNDYTNDYYTDYTAIAAANHLSLLKYMDEQLEKSKKAKKPYQTTIFDFLEE